MQSASELRGHSSRETDIPGAKKIEQGEPEGEIEHGDPAWKARNTVHIYTCTHSYVHMHTIMQRTLTIENTSSLEYRIIYSLHFV